ncbi:hypothetical protein CTAYLR_009929 [Chrysophaeum taylorii]|uniref:Uncharacterized protein n=1 Tax=Chrysophaeum taylorii TaxID=2483200 RepID=A0AAD7XMR7_9STRA|nr:hypothetical protein CTAYLR_009929 [Chrysophaeum taylorii]
MWRRRRISALKTAGELSTFELQDLFEPDYLQKKLFVKHPNRAFGAVFKLEGAVADVDVIPTFTAAWGQVAEEFGVEKPTEETVSLADWGEARMMSRRYNDIVSESFDDLDITPRPGVEGWLSILAAEEVPCAVVSKLPRRMLETCLQRLNYTGFFNDNIVSAEDERDRAEQAFLHAALIIERQPARCVVFSDTISDVVGAHEADMRAVGLMGTHPAYELRIADLVVSSLDELRLPNVRGLFADVDYEQHVMPEPELEPEVRRQVRTKTLEREQDYDDYYY